MDRPEILSPCGSPEALRAALCAGADAVYLGAKNFSARHNAANFTDDELRTAVSECHRRGVMVYLAFNTVIKDNELPAAADLLKLACEIGIDGLIIQDLAVYEMARAACPDMPLHASTQMTIHTPAGVEAAKALGFKRVVVSRELSLDDIAGLCNRGVEIEAFAHGALCMSVSGQCYLSAVIGSRSANRGLCAGACRLPFSSWGRRADKYALSLKDMSYCGHALELAAAGVSSLKIEGRMKRPEYVAAATDALRRALDGEDCDSETLRAVFSRSGFTDGYLTGRLGKEMFGARVKEDVTAAEAALPRLRKIYEKTEKRFTLDLSFAAAPGEPVKLTASDSVNAVTVTGEPPEKAVNRETDPETVNNQLIKLGGTIYAPGKVSAEVAPGLSIPLSKINALRREAIEDLDKLRIDALSKPVGFDPSGLEFDFPLPLIRKVMRFRLRPQTPEQLKLISLCDEEMIIPIERAEEFVKAGYPAEKSIIALPRFDVNEKNTAERLVFAKSLGYGRVECSNIGHIALAKSLGMTPQGGFGLNITNTVSARHYFKAGLETLTLSFELKAGQCSAIACPGELGAIIYGRLPLMVMRNCPIEAETGCKNCRKTLTDRTGAEFRVICRRGLGFCELVNSRVLRLADRLGEFNLDFGDIMFTDETPKEAAAVLEEYRTGREAEAVPFTRGLYFRGVS